MFEKDIAKFQGVQFRQEFISRIYDGQTMVEACAFLRVNPAACGIYMRDNPEFEEAVYQAQAFRIELKVDSLENIQDIESDAIMAGVISKNIQWVASRRKRARYGEKLDVAVTHTINIREAIETAQTRTLKHMGAIPLEVLDNSTDNVSVEHVVLPVIDAEIDPLS